MKALSPDLGKRLDALVRNYGVADLGDDPLLFPRRFRDRLDREVSGFLASSLAYGNVLQIRRSVENALACIAKSGKRPGRFVLEFEPRRDGAFFRGFVHRFHRGRDLACLFFLLRQAIESHGSLGAFFAAGMPPGTSLREGLISFVSRMEWFDPGPFYRGRWPACGKGVRFFLASPQNGSACKRLCLFLRWMVRRESPDLGLWPEISPASLVMPVDTHIARIAHRLRLIRLPSATWVHAEELTENLRRFDASDPVRYDFALSRIGILEGWPRKMPRRHSARRIVELCETPL